VRDRDHHVFFGDHVLDRDLGRGVEDLGARASPNIFFNSRSSSTMIA